jgi:uncharacterized protein YcaQ
MIITLNDLRRFTVARNFFKPTTLKRALHRMGFLQADPIRAPARAQDLILRQRVNGYRAGELERRYRTLDIEEDFFINYGFVTSRVHALMHPRPDSLTPTQARRSQPLLEFVRQHGAVHPREVDEHFAHGKVTNYWGGSSNATTRLLDALHYLGRLRIVRREKGIRIYAAYEHEPAPTEPAEIVARIDALVDVAVNLYAPLPGRSLAILVRRLRSAVPQWQVDLNEALARSKQRLAQARVDGVGWYWPAQESPLRGAPPEGVKLLAPFDPAVHDRARFELLWGWPYRFEAYTPIPKRKLGYYAMPLLWRDRVIGWGNLSVKDGNLESDFGYAAGRPPRDRAFRDELEAELDRVRLFLGLRVEANFLR